ncbi:MAG: hypothetical protein ABIC57_03605 [bacterium]
MKVFKYLIYIVIVGVLGYFLVNLITGGMKKEESENQDSDQEEQQEEEEGNSNEEDEADTTETDFSDFSDEEQTVGETVEGVEYTLSEISNEEMSGYHRFIFTLESDEDTLPLVEASLVSSGGYIKVVLNNVTSDQSGIAYNSYESIDVQGITRLYHDVTAVETEEVYNVGISSDTVFYLRDDGMDVILEVKYPGEVEAQDNNDPEDFTTEDVKLDGTNTEGDAKIVGYSWGVEEGAVKFIWETSSASGNPTPPTTAVYDEDANTVTVTFSDLASDSILASTGSFEMEMSRAVDQVTGSIDGGDHVFVFELNSDIEYKIYREVSPNQVVIEIR